MDDQSPSPKRSRFPTRFFRAPAARKEDRCSRYTGASTAAGVATPSARDERSLRRDHEGKTFSAWAAPSPLARSSNETMMSSFCSSSSSSANGSFAFGDELLASHLVSPLAHDIRVQGWMYWARTVDESDGQPPQPPSKAAGRYTKVFVVLRNEFLLLYRSSTRGSAKPPSPLVQIAVASAYRAPDGAFHVVDPYGEPMELHPYNRDDVTAAHRWELALEQAAELTQWHFSAFDVKVEELSRGSMYRGTLHDSRVHSARSHSLRKTVHRKLKGWSSLRSALLPVARLAHLGWRAAPP